jgi:hypothetical protein
MGKGLIRWHRRRDCRPLTACPEVRNCAHTSISRAPCSQGKRCTADRAVVNRGIQMLWGGQAIQMQPAAACLP